MINELFNLSGKVALVTGGTHGIGMACGIALAGAGAKLCVNSTTVPATVNRIDTNYLLSKIGI